MQPTEERIRVTGAEFDIGDRVVYVGLWPRRHESHLHGVVTEVRVFDEDVPQLGISAGETRIGVRLDNPPPTDSWPGPDVYWLKVSGLRHQEVP